jgi:3-oxoacyl-[acyl-carrier-protein] synthase II
VVITGIGVVSAIGIGSAAYWTALRSGVSGVAPIEGFPLPQGSPHLGAEVRNFNARDFIKSAHARRMDKLSRFITAATRMAVEDARLPLAERTDRVGVVVGTAVGNLSETGTHLERLYVKGPSGVSPLIFPNLVMNAPASYVGMELGLTGVNLTVAQGEISGEQAIVLACDLIRDGRADVVLAGGGDELSGILFHICRRARGLSGQRGGKEWCSPYDVDRNGVVLGEGGAMLVLESADHARRRNALVQAEIAGTTMFSVTAPAYDWPNRALAARTALGALIGGDGLRVDEMVCGAGNSSRRLDACELDLMAALAASQDAPVWLTSIKGAVGEFGAAGALSTATACLALRDQTVPPLCHLRTPEVAAGVRLPATAQSARIDRALVCTIARGGAGAAVLLRRAPV